MDKLKPCPFCGAQAELSLCALPTEIQGREWMNKVICSECDASTGFCATEEVAIKAWNRRDDNG